MDRGHQGTCLAKCGYRYGWKQARPQEKFIASCQHELGQKVGEFSWGFVFGNQCTDQLKRGEYFLHDAGMYKRVVI